MISLVGLYNFIWKAVSRVEIKLEFVFVSKQSSSFEARVADGLKVWSINRIYDIGAFNWIWVGNHDIAMQSHCISLLYTGYYFLSIKCVSSIGTEWMGC